MSDDLGQAIINEVQNRNKQAEAEPKPGPIPIALPTVRPKLKQVGVAWRAWWEGYDFWDGNDSYADLDTARMHAAMDYASEEYHWPPCCDDDECCIAADGLVWQPGNGLTWHLFDGERDTLVQVYQEPVYGPEETQT